MSFGKRIVELRKQNNMTQTDLGNQLNISAQAISKWERDLAEPDLATLKKMAEIFNMSVDEMLDIKKDEPANLEDELKDEEDSDKENVTQNNVNNYYIVNNINEESNNSKQSQSDVIDNLDKVLSLKAENLSCEKCGSSDIYIIDDQTAECKHCGAKIDRKKVIVNNIKNNNYYNNENSDDKGNVYYVKPKLDKNEFLRKALTSISLDNDTPVNVLNDGNFSDISEERLEFFLIKARYYGDITATIGYDRKEKYEDYEQYYDTNLGKHCTRKVIKERTVTDWHPYSATYFSNEVSVALDDENKEDKVVYVKDIKGNDVKYNYAQLFEDTLSGSDCVLVEEAGIEYSEHSKVSAKITKAVLSRGAEKAHNKIQIPGDHVKNYSYTTDYEIIEERAYIIDMYTLRYTFEGNEYYVKSFANGYYPIYTNPNDLYYQEKDVDKLSIGYSTMSIMFSIFAIFMAFYNFMTKTEDALILVGVCMLLSILMYKFYKNRRNKIKGNYLKDRRSQKINKLNSYLSNKNLKSMTVDELKEFGK